MRKWVAIVTRVDARIFDFKDFKLVAKLSNQLGGEKNRALRRGKPGLRHSKFTGSSGVYNLTGEKNPHEDAAIAFAKQIGEFLRVQTHLNKFDHVTVVAEPKMLGRVKRQLDKSLVAKTDWSARDLGKLSAHELRKVIHI